MNVQTGSINRQMPAQPYPHGRKAQPRNGPPFSPNQHSSSFQTPVEIIPNKNDRNGFSTGLNNLSEAIGQSSLRRLLISTVAFFVLFAIVALTKFYFDHSQSKALETARYQSESISNAKSITRTLDHQIAWMDTAIGVSGSSQQTIDFVTRGQGVIAAALIDQSGRILSETPKSGEALKQIDRRNFPKGGVQVSSLIGKDGIITPVITRRAQEKFLIIALTPGILLNQKRPNMSVVLDGGRVIDGPPQIGTAGTLDHYALTNTKLNTLTSSSESEISPHKIYGQKVWITSARVPNSFLTVVDTHPRKLSPSFLNNLLLFSLLFAGSAWLIWTLLRNMLRQLSELREQKTAEEVSQQRYRAALDGSRGGVWEIDVSRNQAYISQSLAELLGLPTKEHTLSMPQFLGLFHSADRDKLLSLIRRSHVSGEFEIDVNSAHLPISLACRGRPSIRGSDQAKVVIGMALDVTEMRGAQTRLQAAEARLVDALSSMNDSFVIWDQLDRLVLWNNKFADFFGIQASSLQQGLDYATVEYHANNAIENTYSLEDGAGSEIQLKDGRWIRYLETHTVDGGRVSIGTEVTAIRTREHQLQVNQDALQKTINVLKKSQVRIVELAENYEQEKIRAEEANHSKSEFLANMSHELRTPLNAINGFSDIMKKEMFGPLGDPRYKEYVSDILFSGQHLLSLINDILDMSKIEAGKMTLNTQVLQMNDMIGQVIRIVRGRADDNRLKLIYDEISLPEIEADPRAVKQILLNLTTNAIKFTPEGGVVTIAVEPKSAGLIIRVSDTGIGISEDDIQRLAQPFEQIDSQHSRKHEGTGLGLALSKSLVELHGGNFKIESVVGEGTTVIFTLPNKPRIVQPVQTNTEVGNEISRLAQDIADVLTVGEMGNIDNTSPLPVAPPPPITTVPAESTPSPEPTEFIPHQNPITQPAQSINPAA